MPKLAVDQLPAYRLHRQSGQAVVTLNGRDFLLGEYNSEKSRGLYSRRVAEWMANNRCLPNPAEVPGLLPMAGNDLYTAFQQHADTYYRRADGTATSEADNFRDAMKPVLRMYGTDAVTVQSPHAIEGAGRSWR